MRNMPVFATQFGVASLILDQIPYTESAYVHIQDSEMPLALLEECVGFCRAVGAQKVYATGDHSLSKYPLFMQIVGMEVASDQLEDTDAVAMVASKEAREQWRQIYNERMQNVDNAAYINSYNMDAFFDNNDVYFVYLRDELIGIGKASNGYISVVASVVPGRGKETVLALAKVLQATVIALEVSSTNLRAIKLYAQLGFVETEVRKTWYKII